MLNRIRTLALNMSAWNWLPALCFAVLPALIVRRKWIIVAADATEWWGDYFIGDIRTWWKAAFTLGIVAWMLCLVVCRIVSGWRAKRKPLALLAVGASCAILAATWLSPFPYTRWAGYTGLYEGALAFLAYLFALWYVSEMEQPSKRMLVIRAVIVVAAINIVLAILAGVHHDFWQSELGTWVIGLPKSMIRYNFANTNMASGTAYQPNHYGMLMAMIGSLSLGMIFVESKRFWRNIWIGIYTFSIISLLFSRSRAGTMVLITLTIIFSAVKLYGWRKYNISYLRLTKPGLKKLALAASAILLVVLLFAFLGFGEAGKVFLERSAQLFTKMPLNSEITDVALADNVITVKTLTRTVAIGKLSATSWYATPENARRSVLQFTQQGEWRVAQLPGVNKTTLSVNQRGNALLRGPDTNLEFFALGAELFAVDQTKTNLRLRTDIPFSTYTPTGYEGFLSARGYIWARSLEKWRERPWFGWGPGSLPLVFPNQELLNKKRYSWGADEDKGHSILVTFLVQTGIIGTILYFLPFGYALYVLARSKATLRMPLLLAMSAYIVCGLTNDSTTGVTPLFCVFAGLAVAEAKDKTVETQA